MSFDPSLTAGNEESIMMLIQPTIAVPYLLKMERGLNGIDKENSCDQ